MLKWLAKKIMFRPKPASAFDKQVAPGKRADQTSPAKSGQKDVVASTSLASLMERLDDTIPPPPLSLYLQQGKKQKIQ